MRVSGRSWAFVVSVLCAACGSGSPATDASGGAGGAAGASGTAGSGGVAGAAGVAGTAGVAGAAGASGSGGSGAWGGTGGAAGAGTCTGALATLPAPTILDATTAKELTIVGDPGAARGVFDPSVEYPAGAASGAMSYSVVQAPNDVSTRVAVSSDQGATWTYAATVNTAEDTAVTTSVGYAHCPSGSCTGRLVHEVSSLVLDTDDVDASRRYKLFTHSYVVFPGDVLAYDIGTIDIYTAPAAAGPWKFESKALGWNSASKLSSQGVVKNVSEFAQMQDCVMLTEPGAIVRPGGLLQIAVGCGSIVGGAPRIRIELLQSVDAGKSFQYVARITTGEDALCLGYGVPQLNAADLFVAGGKSYIALSPAGPTSGGFDGYRGCLVFPLNALGSKIVTDGAGALTVSRLIAAPDDRFLGACSYAEGASAMGYAVSALRLENAPDAFHMYASAVKAP